MRNHVDEDLHCYLLLLSLNALEPLKVNILLILAHLAPNTLSGKELTILLGYSPSARTIYRGVLDELQESGYILLHKEKTQYAISINAKHPQMASLIKLSEKHGEKYRSGLLQILEENR